MATKYFSVHFFLLFTTLMTIATFAEVSLLENRKELPNGFSVMDGNDDSGEICDPNSKSIACESPTAKCVWRPLDMVYKCTEPRPRRVIKRKQLKEGLDDNKDGHRKRMVKGFETPTGHRTSNVNSYSLKNKADGKLSPDLPSSPDTNTPKDVDEEGNQIVNETTPQSSSVGPQMATESLEGEKAIQNSQEEAESRALIVQGAPHLDKSHIYARQLNNPPDGTLEVPKYYGDLTWDGKNEYSETCILKSVMADALQKRISLDLKKQWVEDNRAQICNFRKFFHCTIEQRNTELDLKDEDDDDDGPTEPVCRCYESAMPVVNRACYIPADLGAKSQCGDHVTAPYPIHPWSRAPILKPRCTPNSDCKESQYWFGRRCTCRYNARYNPQTHTCDTGTKSTLSRGLLFASYAIILLQFRKE